jgi:hypothetical protein
MKHLALAAAVVLATSGSISRAQSPVDHEKHHPDQKEAPTASQPTPSRAQPGIGPAPGMHGMMGGSMKNIMGGRTPMMDMMPMLGMMRPSDGDMGMATIDRVEGRIAFLRAELRITDAQNDAWNAFADALRANARNLSEVRSSIMATQQGLVERLALLEGWLAARLEGTRAIKSGLTALASTLSDDQKKTADDLLAPHMGMMTMQSGRMKTGMKPGQ